MSTLRTVWRWAYMLLFAGVAFFVWVWVFVNLDGLTEGQLLLGIFTYDE